jgi:hypothetical protein
MPRSRLPRDHAKRLQRTHQPASNASKAEALASFAKVRKEELRELATYLESRASVTTREVVENVIKAGSLGRVNHQIAAQNLDELGWKKDIYKFNREYGWTFSKPDTEANPIEALIPAWLRLPR